MKYYKFVSDTSYPGTEQRHYHKFSEEPDKEELEAMAEGYSENAFEDYSYLATGWNGDFETEEEEESFRGECTCYYKEISEEEFENEN